ILHRGTDADQRMASAYRSHRHTSRSIRYRGIPTGDRPQDTPRLYRDAHQSDHDADRPRCGCSSGSQARRCGHRSHVELYEKTPRNSVVEKPAKRASSPDSEWSEAMKRAAVYLRVSTQDQTTSNQEHELRQAAERAGWQVAKVYKDHGISGAKGRNGRPAFDALCRDAIKRQFDVVMAWNVDRLGRSLKDLVAFLSELHALGIDLFLHQQGLDTTTPAGKAMFQMLGVFAEFEHSIIQERVRAGLQRAKREGKRLGRPPIADKLAERIRAALAGGMRVRKTAAKFDVNPSTVQRVAHPFEGADNASVAGAA